LKKLNRIYKNRKWLFDQYWNKHRTITEIADYCNGSRTLIYRWLDKYNYIGVQKTKKKICEFCQRQYKATTLHGISRRQKYCSRECREKAWKKNNPERWKEHQRNYGMKEPKYCKYCTDVIPKEERVNGKQYCSKVCSRLAHNARQRVARKITMGEFLSMKESVGCQICAYDTCGACLDFHHLDGNGKENRISHYGWYNELENTIKEMEKCVILCKNCHLELHYFNEDGKCAENGEVFK